MNLRFCDKEQLIRDQKDDNVNVLILDPGTNSTGLAILNLRNKKAEIINYVENVPGNYKLSRLAKRLIHYKTDCPVPQLFRHDPKKLGNGMSTQVCSDIANKIAKDNTISFFLTGISAKLDKQRPYPLKKEHFTALVQLLEAFNGEKKWKLRSFSAIDETNSSNAAELFLKSSHPHWFSFDDFCSKYEGLRLHGGYRNEGEFRAEFHTLRKDIVDCISAVWFSEKYSKERVNDDEISFDQLLMKEAIENFFAKLGYKTI